MDRAWGAAGWTFGPSGVCIGRTDTHKIASFEQAHLWLFYDMQSTFYACSGGDVGATFGGRFEKSHYGIFAFESEQSIDAQQLRHEYLEPAFIRQVQKKASEQGGVGSAFAIGVWQMSAHQLVCVSLESIAMHQADAFMQNEMRQVLGKTGLHLIGMQTPKCTPVAMGQAVHPTDWSARLREFKSIKERRALDWSLGVEKEQTQSSNKRL